MKYGGLFLILLHVWVILNQHICISYFNCYSKFLVKTFFLKNIKVPKDVFCKDGTKSSPSHKFSNPCPKPISNHFGHDMPFIQITHNTPCHNFPRERREYLFLISFYSAKCSTHPSLTSLTCGSTPLDTHPPVSIYLPRFLLIHRWNGTIIKVQIPEQFTNKKQGHFWDNKGNKPLNIRVIKYITLHKR